MRKGIFRSIARCVVLALLLASKPAAAQGSDDSENPHPDADADPTRPILGSLRDEYDRLPDHAWANATILRFDMLAIRNAVLPGSARGILLRADFPVVTSSVGGVTHFGTGDLYGQAVVVPRLGQEFTLAAGAGAVFPTATSPFTGSGKWQVAPIVAPVWFLPNRQGLAYLKVQDFISVAGHADRPGIDYLLVTPTLFYWLSSSIFVLGDTEANTDWKAGARTSLRSGLQVGSMFTRRMGMWIKGEVPWGPNREGLWTLKVTAFVIR
ncbi:MAG: hypothetical protein JST54_11765 [Deltaproteobacteria bacterium]|nr:hypothetical protein [Deltaproteobacteria bacterium]